MRSSNSSELVNQKEEEIQTVTRNAYLYAAGITLLTLVSVLMFTWAFYVGQVSGMICRIILTMAIYSKVFLVCTIINFVNISVCSFYPHD